MNHSEKRAAVLNELVATEESYLRLIAPLANAEIREQILAYANSHPMSHSQKLDTLDLSMFRHGLALVGNLYQQHKNVLEGFKELRSALENEQDVSTICLALSANINNMVKDHSNFALFFEQYTKMIAPKFSYVSAELGEIILNDSEKMQALGSALVAPIQRLPRYVMLFKEACKSINKENSETKLPELSGHENLTSLSVNVKESADQVNKIKKNLEVSLMNNNVAVLLSNRASIFEFENDSRFRRGIKDALNQVMMRDGTNAIEVADKLNAMGLTMASEGKKFSNKRYYNFSNNEGIIFSIKVNRNTMTFIFAEEFNYLTAEQKKEIHQLQHDLVKLLATTMDLPGVAHMTPSEFMTYIASQEDFNDFEAEKDDDSSDDEYDLDLGDTLIVQEPSQATLLFRDKLAGVIGANKGLTRQGSYIKPADKHTAADSTRIKASGFAYVR